MKREDIERAAEKYANDVFLDNAKISVDNPWPEFRDTYRIAFEIGAEWRINSVWHKTTDEKPCVGRNIEVLFENGNTTTWFPTSEIIEDFQKFNVKMWAYLDDLLPDAE